jgi:serine/threonine protein kinase
VLCFTFIEDIFDRVLYGTVDGEVVAKWIIHLVNALNHLHSKGFFHRSIGNGTVMVTADDHVLLGGFEFMIEALHSD